LLAAIPSVLMMMLTGVLFIAAGFVVRVLELLGPVGRLSARVRMKTRRAMLAMGLDKPVVLAQALTGLGVIAILAFWLNHRALINAWTARFNSAPIDWLLPMGPHNFERLYYRVQLDVLLLVFSVGLWRVVQLRRRHQATDEKASLAMLSGIILVIVLLIAFSYRILTWRDFERVDLAGARCYITGQAGEEFLVLCPASTPPRNRVVGRDEPSLRRLGIIENVFEGVAAPPERTNR
jgi:hypothetical protein